VMWCCGKAGSGGEGLDSSVCWGMFWILMQWIDCCECTCYCDRRTTTVVTTKSKILSGRSTTTERDNAITTSRVGYGIQ
jgi:hypothetical protein